MSRTMEGFVGGELVPRDGVAMRWARCDARRIVTAAGARRAMRRATRRVGVLEARRRAAVLVALSASAQDEPRTAAADRAGATATDARLWRRIADFANNLYLFSRPHTMIGTFVSVVSVSALATRYLIAATTADAALIGSCAAATAVALACALLVNVYIVGLNQLCDVDVDRINKPELPLASGQWSTRTGTYVIVGALALCTAGFALGSRLGLTSPALLATLVGSAVLGTVYSLPPFRLKRFPFLASLCILCVRGVMVNLGFFAHIRYVVGGVSAIEVLRTWSNVWFPVLFFVVFGVVIALLKDVPDVIGDQQFALRSFAVRLGPQALFTFSTRLLSVLYLASSLYFLSSLPAAASLTASLSSSRMMQRAALVLFHMIAAAAVVNSSSRVDATSSTDVYAFYMWIWKLFYLEYGIIPFTL